MNTMGSHPTGRPGGRPPSVRILLAPVLALALVTAAGAQERLPQEGAAAVDTRAPGQEVDPASMLRAALQVARMVDDGQIGETWDGASEPVKAIVARPLYVRNIVKARQALGASSSRAWTTIMRQQITPQKATAGKAPAGDYVSVVFATTFANGRNGSEQVSFRYDEDHIWRLSGYIVR